MLTKVLLYLTALCGLATFVAATPLDDYVWKADPAYGWTDMVGRNRWIAGKSC